MQSWLLIMTHNNSCFIVTITSSQYKALWGDLEQALASQPVSALHSEHAEETKRLHCYCSVSEVWQGRKEMYANLTAAIVTFALIECCLICPVESLITYLIITLARIMYLAWNIKYVACIRSQLTLMQPHPTECIYARAPHRSAVQYSLKLGSPQFVVVKFRKQLFTKINFLVVIVGNH